MCEVCVGVYIYGFGCMNVGTGDVPGYRAVCVCSLRPGCEFQTPHLPAGWVSYFTSLPASFLVCQIRIMLTSSQSYCED